MQERHRDVAAYALGVLEPADAFRFEEHLSDCVTCTVQLSDFASLAASLSELGGPGRVEPPCPPGSCSSGSPPRSRWCGDGATGAGCGWSRRPPR